MSSLRTRLSVAVAIAATLSIPAIGTAQGVDVGVLALAARHQLLGNRLTGGSATMNFPQGAGQLVFRLGLERATGAADRLGTTCTGLIQAGTCSPERVRDDARLTSAIGGAAVRLVVVPHLSVAFEGDIAVASVHADTRGLTSGTTVAASKVLWGPRLGLNMSWRPMTTVPVAIGIGVTDGVLAPVAHQRSAYGYAPFERGFGVRTARVGLVWQAPVR